jgi:hypothetical protein
MQPVTNATQTTQTSTTFPLPSPDAYDAYLASRDAASVAGWTHSASNHPLAGFLQHLWRTENVRVHPAVITVNGVSFSTPTWMRAVLACDKRLVRNTRLSHAQARAFLVAALEEPYTPPSTSYPIWDDSGDE